MPGPLDVLPIAEDTGLPWDVAVDDAVAAIASARARCGDTFVVNSGGSHYLFPFSPTGVESFYGLREEQASKGLADYVMLRRKLPDEVFTGRRTLPSSLFRRDDVSTYLANLEHVLDATEAEFGQGGSMDVFEVTRRLGHRMGLASWAGPHCADGEAFDRLVRAFDDVADVIEVSVRKHDSGATADEGLFGRIVEAWASEPTVVRNRGIAMDVALIHVASMSNLVAALAGQSSTCWCIRCN